MKIQRGDMVKIIAGQVAAEVPVDEQPPRRVIQVLAGGRKLIVEGVNNVMKHVRRGHPKSPQGGRLNLELPIDASNVVYFCQSCQKPSRIGFQFSADGAKERYCKKCKASAGTISPPKKRYAQG